MNDKNTLPLAEQNESSTTTELIEHDELEPAKKNRTSVSALLRLIATPIERIIQFLSAFVSYFFGLFRSMTKRLKQKLSDLNVSQWLYVVAALILLMNVDTDIEADSALIRVGAIAGIGLLRELWHVFNRLWENILGKGLVLVLYAATANFALAIAALKINSITGVEPSPFIFALGFTTLLMLPFWLLVSTIVFFSVALIVSNLWLIFSVLLRLIRIKVQVHWEDKSFVFATMLLRVILIPYVIMSIFFVAFPFAEQIEIFDNPISQIRQAIEDEKITVSEAIATDDQTADVTIDVGVEPQINQAIALENKFGEGVIDKLVANFIYNFETYPKSACKKTAEQRSLIIDENMVLLAEKDDSPLGYRFFIAPCEGNFTSAESKAQTATQ